MIGPAGLVSPLYKCFQFLYLFFLLDENPLTQTLLLCILLFISIVIAVVDRNFVRSFIDEQDFVNNLIEEGGIVADNQHHSSVIF